MKDTPINVDRVLDLAEAVCDQNASQSELVELDSLVLADEALSREYLDYCQMHAALQLELRAQRAAQKVRCQIDVGSIVPVLGESDTMKVDSSAAVPFGFLASTFSSTLGTLSSGWPVAYLVALAVFGIGFVVGSLVPLSPPVHLAEQSQAVTPDSRPAEPRMEFVGRITGMSDCQWSDPNTAAPGLVAVSLGRKYALASGMMEITYNTGAKVILQGPCTYEVESKTGGYLSVGKLTARVEKKAEGGGWKAEETTNLPSLFGRGTRGEDGRKNGSRSESQRALTLTLSQGERGPDSSSALRLPPSALFSVRTPTATVTDLGTEFGVEVDKTGATLSRVFRGSVRVQTHGSNGNAEGPGQVLHESESARVETASGQADASRITLVDAAAKQTDFVRAIPKRILKTLSLVDVVAGGDGFSSRCDRGIDPTTGRSSDVQPDDINSQGDYKYHRVEGMPFVDGVFIPEGSAGPVQIDSAGHVFPDCPKTDNCCWAYVWAGGKLPEAIGSRMSPILADIDYSSSEHSVLVMHANKGITFDLDAIRRANPGSEVLRLRAVAGNVEAESPKGSNVSADIWVLVDGQVRFKRREFNSFSGAAPVVVPLHANERFLTLAVTDGGNSYMCDQIIFGDPHLELAKPTIPVNDAK